MNASFTTPEAGQLHPHQAIILYRDTNNYTGDSPTSVATINPIEMDGGKIQIMPGAPVTRADLDTLISALAESDTRRAKPPKDKSAALADAPQPSAYLSQNIVALGANCLSWVCTSARRPIYFNAHGDYDKPLAKLSGKTVTHPHLLFIAGRRGNATHLTVYALPDDRRPKPETILCHAPYFNLSSGGWMCQGSAPLPHYLHPSSIPAFERAFFESNFTHTNRAKKELTRHPRGHHVLWATMRTLKNFPARWLVRTKLTLSKALLLNEK